jgi:hypothetical protein
MSKVLKTSKGWSLLETELTDGSAGYDVRYADNKGIFLLPLLALGQRDALKSFDLIVNRVVGVELEASGKEAGDGRD